MGCNSAVSAARSESTLIFSYLLNSLTFSADLFSANSGISAQLVTGEWLTAGGVGFSKKMESNEEWFADRCAAGYENGAWVPDKSAFGLLD